MAEPIPKEAFRPRPAERIPVDSLSSSLLKGTRGLVRDGMDHLRRNWYRLPRLKMRLLREGEALDRKLQAASSATTELTARGCGWYIEVRLLRGTGANGNDPRPEQAEALVNIKEELTTLASDPDSGQQPRSDEPAVSNRQLATAVLKLVDVVGGIETRMEAGFAELKEAMDKHGTELDGIRGTLDKHGTELGEIRGTLHMHGTRLDSLDGRVGNMVGERYEQQFRNRLPDQIHIACRQANIPHPATVDLLWSDRHGGRFTALCLELQLDAPQTELLYCDFLYRLQWNDGPPPLLLVGEISTTVDERVLEKIEHHRRDLEAVGHEVRALLVGAGFTSRVAALGGSAAVTAAGALWLERPEDLKDRAWQDTDEIAAMLEHWHGRESSGA